jgi:glycosyltransferase involved in cell wall biosynthesis
MKAKTEIDRVPADLMAGEGLGRCVARHGLGQAGIVYGFNSASHALFRYAKTQGARCVVEQTIAPRIVERQILQREHELWPEWEGPQQHTSDVDEFCEREAAEWGMADLVVCGSEFVRNGIEAAGGPVSKCEVVPYGVDVPDHDTERTKGGEAFRVLFAGAVGLRKGAQYLYAAACTLRSKRIRIRMVGPLQLRSTAVKLLREVADVVGPVSRMDMRDEYSRADVLVLPTLLEGSATVCYEAMAAGIPVVTTPNAGSVVRDGVDGFIVPAHDPEALAQRLAELASDPARAREMGRMAKTRAAEFTVADYGKRLVEVLRRLAS